MKKYAILIFLFVSTCAFAMEQDNDSRKIKRYTPEEQKSLCIASRRLADKNIYDAFARISLIDAFLLGELEIRDEKKVSFKHYNGPDDNPYMFTLPLETACSALKQMMCRPLYVEKAGTFNSFLRATASSLPLTCKKRVAVLKNSFFLQSIFELQIERLILFGMESVLYSKRGAVVDKKRPGRYFDATAPENICISFGLLKNALANPDVELMREALKTHKAMLPQLAGESLCIKDILEDFREHIRSNLIITPGLFAVVAVGTAKCMYEIDSSNPLDQFMQH